MNDRCFLDTNIFIYSIDRRDAVKELKSTELVRDSLSSHKGVVSFQVVQEFFNAQSAWWRPCPPNQRNSIWRESSFRSCAFIPRWLSTKKLLHFGAVTN